MAPSGGFTTTLNRSSHPGSPPRSNPPVPVEEGLQEEVETVDVAQRALAVWQAREEPRVVGLAGQPQLPHEHVVRVLPVVHERGAPLYVRAVGRQRPRAARLAPVAGDGDRAPPPVCRGRYAQLVAGEARLDPAPPVALELGGGDRVERLVDLDTVREHDAVLDPLEYQEELGEPVGRGGRRPAVGAGDLGEAVEGEQLYDELAPVGDGDSVSLEDRAGHRGEGPPAGAAGPPPDAPGVPAGALSAAVAFAYPPAAWAAAAVREGSLAGLLAFAALSLALPVVVTLALAACYPHANAAATSGPRRRTRPAATSRGAASPLRALTVKELRRIGSMPFYALNSCAGLLLMVVAAIAIALFGADALLTSGVINGVRLDVQAVAAMRVQVDAALPWVFGFCGAMSLTSTPRGLARGARELAHAHGAGGRGDGARLQAPRQPRARRGRGGGLRRGTARWRGGAAPLLALQCVVAAVGMLTGFASVALAIDASRPNLSWTSPSEVVKRGLPVMVGSIGGVLASFGLGFLSVTAAGTLGPAASVAVNLAAPTACALGGLALLHAVARCGLPGPGWGE